MRHLGSLALSLVGTALMYVLAGVGAVKLAIGNLGPDGKDWAALGIGFAAVIGAGIVYAILLLTRLSPLGLVLSGLALLGFTLWALLSESSFQDAIPADLLGVKNAGYAPVGALTILVSVPLMATVFSPRRWRRHADGQTALVAPGGWQPDTTPYPSYDPAAASNYPAPTSGAPTYPTVYTPPSDPYASTDASNEATLAGPTVVHQPTSPASDPDGPTRPL